MSENVIPSLNMEYYDTGGEILISPDGEKAVYALARIRNFGTANQSIETIFVLVDLQNMTQERLRAIHHNLCPPCYMDRR